jgi:hypothetical protein
MEEEQTKWTKFLRFVGRLSGPPGDKWLRLGILEKRRDYPGLPEDVRKSLPYLDNYELKIEEVSDLSCTHLDYAYVRTTSGCWACARIRSFVQGALVCYGLVNASKIIECLILAGVLTLWAYWYERRK